MPKDQFLVIRLDKKELERVKGAAREDHLAPATWARRALLKAVDRQEGEAEE